MINYSKQSIAKDINTVAAFLARRDIKELTNSALLEKIGIPKVDLLIILGSSLINIAEAGANAFQKGLAKELMLVGGLGHSTKYLVENIQKYPKYQDIAVADRPEADILKDVIAEFLPSAAENLFIENQSTNCGSNAKEALKTLLGMKKSPETVLILQDPTMQLRTHAAFEKEWEQQRSRIVSYSLFVPEVRAVSEQLEFTNTDVDGLWSVERFIDLIMGEIPRLRDDINGYGPKGKGFIAHVEIPKAVEESYSRLLDYFSDYKEIKLRK